LYLSLDSSVTVRQALFGAVTTQFKLISEVFHVLVFGVAELEDELLEDDELLDEDHPPPHPPPQVDPPEVPPPLDLIVSVYATKTEAEQV
jgi:hypothetical protein